MNATTTTTCNACGLPSVESFCFRAACLTYGGGACAAGPSIVRTGEPVAR